MNFKDESELKKAADNLRELGLDWKENIAILNSAGKEHGAVIESIRHLCRGSNQNNMLRIGLTLIAFPFPIIIDDVLGWSLLAAGLLQRKIKNSALYIEDVPTILPHLVKEIEETRQEMV